MSLLYFLSKLVLATAPPIAIHHSNTRNSTPIEGLLPHTDICLNYYPSMEFTESGYIIVPRNILDDPIKSDPKIFRGIDQIKKDLDIFWMEVGVLVQAQADLHFDPLRRSDIKAEQDAYWAKFESWITTEAKRQIDSLLERLGAYFTTEGYAKDFATKYPKEEYSLKYDCFEIIYRQYEILWNFCTGFAELRKGDILRSLQPQGKGSRKLIVS